MTDPPQDSTAGRDLTDLLIAISVVARHLARKLEQKEKTNEQDERPDNSAD